MSEETKDEAGVAAERTPETGAENQQAGAPITNMNELVAMQQAETEAINKKYDELFDQLAEGGYFKQGYGDDSVVQIPGKLFGEFVNFVNAQMQTLYAVGSTIEIMNNTNNSMITNLSHMTIRLMEQHKANVDAGATTSMEELDKEDAKKNIKVAKKTEKKKSEKATGSK